MGTKKVGRPKGSRNKPEVSKAAGKKRHETYKLHSQPDHSGVLESGLGDFSVNYGGGRRMARYLHEEAYGYNKNRDDD